MLPLKRAAAAALVWFAAAIAPAHATERITRFVSDVSVQRNGDLLVTETIAVVTEGDRIKRGILRDFPTSYNNRDGSHVEIGFDVLSVQRDGVEEAYTTERLSNGTRVRIGRADRLLAGGPHQYVIAYRTTRQIGFSRISTNCTGTPRGPAGRSRSRLPKCGSRCRRRCRSGRARSTPGRRGPTARTRPSSNSVPAISFFAPRKCCRRPTA